MFTAAEWGLPTKIFWSSRSWPLLNSGFGAGSGSHGPWAKRIAVASSIVVAGPKPSDVVFGDLIDLALDRTRLDSTEICEACSTVNLGSARLCKACSHKLPAFYAARSTFEATMPPGPRQPTRLTRSWTWDLGAFWLVITVLACLTALVPVV